MEAKRQAEVNARKSLAKGTQNGQWIEK